MKIDVVEILKIGLSGLVFLLAFFSYRIAEHAFDKPGSEAKFRQLRYYTWQLIALGVLAGTFNVGELVYRGHHLLLGAQDEIAACRDEVSRLQTLASLPQATNEGLRQAARGMASQCQPLLTRLDEGR
jgi:hypothetical protein